MVKTTKPKSATSYKETSFGILPRYKVVKLEQEGVRKILLYILKRRGSRIKITPELICKLHNIGFSFIFPDWAGKFRTIDVTVGSLEPPHFSQIPYLIKNLCDDLKERLKHLPNNNNEEKFLNEVISLLAWFQHRYVWIHPFKDYNGRTARLLTNLILINLELPVLEIKAETKKDRDNYIEAMEIADNNYDYSKLEKLIASALKESLEEV